MSADYTLDQLGLPQVRTINPMTKGQYSLIVVQPRSNEQVVIIEPCDWDIGRARVMRMVRAGVDSRDIRFVFRRRERMDTEGLPLRPCVEALWWTSRDQADLEKERQQETADVG